MRFTKAQRHRIYKEALVELRKEQASGEESCGICTYIQKAAENFDWTVAGDDEAVEHFPEFAAQKPSIASAWWWGMKNYSIRVRVLNRCIRETERKQRTK